MKSVALLLDHCWIRKVIVRQTVLKTYTESKTRMIANWTQFFYKSEKETVKYSKLPLIKQTTSAQHKHPSGKTSSCKEEINPDLSSQRFMVWNATSKLFCAAIEGFAWKTLQIMKYTEHVMTLRNNLPPSFPIICTIVQQAFGLVSHIENYT